MKYPETLKLFISNIIQNETVFAIEKHKEYLCLESDDKLSRAMLFWSNAQRTEELQRNKFSESRMISIPLIEFFYLWLADLSNRLIFVGFDYFYDEELSPIDAYELQGIIADQMPSGLMAQYEQRRNNNPEYLYVHMGTYSNSDARMLLDALEITDIKFDIGADSSQIKGMNALQAAYGGTGGYGAGIHITVHEDDLEKFDVIQQQVFGLLV